MKYLGLLLLCWIWCSPASAEIVVGHYPGGHPFEQIANSDVVRDALAPMGVRLGLIGDFADPEIPAELAGIAQSLHAVWETGGVYVLNLWIATSLRPIAFPATPAEQARSRFYDLAFVIKAWGDACGPHCYFYLLPYPEMNESWVPYRDQPAEFIEAFGKLRYVLEQVGALKYTRMVWGPFTDTAQRMSPYYPGAAWTDVVGCSAYEQLTQGPYSIRACLETLRQVAPGKPILIAQTGACAPGNAAWLRDLVAYLNPQSDVIGFVWFDYNKECDWRVTPEAWRQAVIPLDPRVQPVPVQVQPVPSLAQCNRLGQCPRRSP